MANIEYFVVYNLETGAILWRGQGAPGIAATQQVEPGLAAVQVPQAFLTGTGYDFDAMKAYLCVLVDQQAELARGQFITAGSGQAMEYQEAYDQAVAYQATPAGDYPMIQADVDAETIDPRTGAAVADLAQAADLVIYMYAQWRVAGAAIREARLAAKNAIRAETDNLAAMVAILSSITWPTPGA